LKQKIFNCNDYFLFGGSVAEEIVFDTVTTGAYNDFQVATQLQDLWLLNMV
jgi:ATP-dependent Zn protease